MADFTEYSYQCCPIKVSMPKPGEIDDEEFMRLDVEQNQKADQNMKDHQLIIDKILTEDSAELFNSQKPAKNGKYEDCLAFSYNGKPYPFITLLPKADEKGDGIYMFRIAKLGKKKREENWHKLVDPHEPSAIVIIDNRYDQQRILIEHRSEWGGTDNVRNVLRAALDKILRERYYLTIRIEPVWQKSDFWVALRKYEGHIRSVEFDVGYPNMGRTGNKLLKGIKEECKLMYASPTMKFSVPKETVKKKRRKKGEPPVEEPPTAMTLDPDYQTGLLGELWENCQQNGRTAKMELDNRRFISFGRKPKNVVKQMSDEERKEYEKDATQMYSTSVVKLSDTVSTFNGQDDLFDGTRQEVTNILTAISTRNQ